MKPSAKAPDLFTYVHYYLTKQYNFTHADLYQGTGEALRGNFNAAVDGIAGDRAGVQKNEAIAARGTDEMDHGYHHDRGTGAGVTPVDTTAERHHRNAQGEFTHGTGSTNYGPHATNIGNKVDPRVDSDLDGRGANPPYGTNTYGTNTRV